MPLPISSPLADDLDRVAGLEGAVDRDDPDRQQARAALAQDPGGAVVDRRLARAPASRI